MTKTEIKMAANNPDQSVEKISQGMYGQYKRDTVIHNKHTLIYVSIYMYLYVCVW